MTEVHWETGSVSFDGNFVEIFHNGKSRRCPVSQLRGLSVQPLKKSISIQMRYPGGLVAIDAPQEHREALERLVAEVESSRAR